MIIHAIILAILTIAIIIKWASVIAKRVKK